jgi:cell wall assembly regulator SMI1
MKTVWERIHAWLDVNAPAGYGHLNPPASAEAIQEAEKAMGLELPADVKASYRVHDGQCNEPGLIGGEGWCLLTLHEIVASWRKWAKHHQQFRRCVPVAWGGAGDYVLVDLHSEAERPGRLIVQRRDSDGPDPLARSFQSWLKDFADKLDDGEFAYSEADGCLMYSDEIDLG